MKIESRIEFIRGYLGNHLWHTTSTACFERIMNDGAVRAEPAIDDRLRYNTASGPKHYPYARSIGGVSLFSFSGFDEEEYQRTCPASTWTTFVPVRQDWPQAIWIQIDRSALCGVLIDPDCLLDRWKAEEAHGHNIMPRIEAAHIGDIPIVAFQNVLLVSVLKSGGWSVEPRAFKACRSTPAPR